MEHIIEELMEWFPNGSKSLFYERKYQSDDLQASIKFGQSLGLSAKTKDIFLQNTLNNHTVLSCFGKRAFEADAKPIANLYNWISKYVYQLDNPNFILEESLRQVMRVASAKRFYLQMLEKADFNIVDFREDISTTKVYFDCKAGGKTFTLSLDEQSQGTKKFLSNLSTLYNAISDHHIHFIDEIDSELHDDLLLYFLNTFIMNSNESQLIFTSQETSLLNEDLLNTHRDFVFFAEIFLVADEFRAEGVPERDVLSACFTDFQRFQSMPFRQGEGGHHRSGPLPWVRTGARALFLRE